MGGMMEMIPIVFGPLVMLITGICFAFLTVYLTEEMRANRTGEREPDLGAKVLGGLLVCISIQFSVLGLAFLFGSFTLDGGIAKMVQKVGIGFVGGGIGAAVVPLLILKRTGAIQKVGGKFDFSDRIATKARGICAVACGIMASMMIVFVVVGMVMEGKLSTFIMMTVAYAGSFYLFAMPWLPFGKGGAAAAPPQAGAPGPPPPQISAPPGPPGPPPPVA